MKKVSSDKNKQVFDVAKPGKSAPSSTSKPIIVGHGPILQDPMVNKDDKKDSNGDEPKVTAIRGKVIDPPSEDKDSEPKKPERSEPENGKESNTTEEKPEKKLADDVTASALAGEASKAKGSELTEEELKRQGELEKMIEEKKYFVPIGEITRRKNNKKLLTATLVFLVLAAIGGYLAADFNLIEPPFVLPYEFTKG